MIINHLRITRRSYGAENEYVISLQTYRSYGAYFQTINFIYSRIKRLRFIMLHNILVITF
jgi:hypothetical protein